MTKFSYRIKVNYRIAWQSDCIFTLASIYAGITEYSFVEYLFMILSNLRKHITTNRYSFVLGSHRNITKSEICQRLTNRQGPRTCRILPAILKEDELRFGSQTLITI